MVRSSAAAQSDDGIGMLATVVHQLGVMTDNLAATNQKLDEIISTVTELQQTAARLTDRMNVHVTGKLLQSFLQSE